MNVGTGHGVIEHELRNGVGWVVLSNPARHNAISTTMMAALETTLREYDADPAVHVILLRGHGTRAFAAGADISEFEAQQNTDEAKQASDAAVAALFGTLASVTTPLVVMVYGYCFGAGMAIALSADLRFAEPDAQFAIPAAKLGIGYPVALTHALVDAVGPGHAADMLFTGRTLGAHEACEIGLVNRVVERDQLEADVLAVTAQIAVNAPLSIRAAKASIRARADIGQTERAEQLVTACIGSEDAREGQRAFMERRAPHFEGR